MSIYDIIAENYSKIFPADNERLGFLTGYLTENSRILDTGCATGDIAMKLSINGYNVTGIDLNSKMIHLARSKTAEIDNKPDFHVMNMLDIRYPGIFNLIMCFGNTLPHLQSEEEVAGFFSNVNGSLLNNGHFIFQILNYDKILSEGKINFPVIEDSSFSFRRYYTFPDTGFISFRIEFEDKKSGVVLSDTTNLLPLKRKQLLSLLNHAGFTTIDVYSDYNKTQSDLKEFASLYVAGKF